MSTDPNSIEARTKLVDEHVQAEVDRDLERIMATWGQNPDFDDVPCDEQVSGRDGIRPPSPTSTSRSTTATSPTVSSSSR